MNVLREYIVIPEIEIGSAVLSTAKYNGRIVLGLRGLIGCFRFILRGHIASGIDRRAGEDALITANDNRQPFR